MDNARHCLLYNFSLTKEINFELNKYWHNYNLELDHDLIIHSLTGAYSGDRLDQGTKLLLDTLEQKLYGRVLDLGCGTGIIGAYLKKHNPKIELVMSDINAMAIESTKKTLLENKLEAKVIASDVFSNIEGKFDFIISNPPFHSGIKTDFTMIKTMLSQAKWYLREHGELRIVANSFLPYGEILESIFGAYTIIEKTTKFKVYRVII